VFRKSLPTVSINEIYTNKILFVKTDKHNFSNINFDIILPSTLFFQVVASLDVFQKKQKIPVCYKPRPSQLYLITLGTKYKFLTKFWRVSISESGCLQDRGDVMIILKQVVVRGWEVDETDSGSSPMASLY
jgi:hypothetical protein